MIKRILLITFLSLIVMYLVGPSPKHGRYDAKLGKIPYEGMALEEWVKAREAKAKPKPDNEARIIWANDSSKARTTYAVIYLHGFTASQEEGDPVHLNFARHIGANLYLSRLSEHGILGDKPLMNMTATSLWESAKDAYAIGRKLGDSVIIMGTSTGGTLALMLAAEQYPEIAGVVLLSPNIEINESLAFLLNDHWGLQIARYVKKGETMAAKDTTARYRRYWNSPYRIEGAVEVQQLLEDKMNDETFRAVKQPLLLMYYFRDDVHQDSVVKVSAMLDMFGKISSPVKKKVPIPNAGDHVIGSYLKSHDLETVQREALGFADQLGWSVR
jgi:esterase/lipase